MSAPLTEKTKAQIRHLYAFWDVEDIADFLDVATPHVAKVVADIRRPTQDVVLRDGKSGRIWRLRSWRAAYRTVCQHGLTDWGWWPAKTWDAHQKTLEAA